MMKKRLMIALCCVVLLVQFLPIVPMAETTEAWAIDQDLYYCRAELAKYPNSADLLFAYDNIVAGINASAEKITISNGEHNLSEAEFKLVMDSVRRDHTEQFWLARGYSFKPNSQGYITEMTPTYLMQGEALKNAKVAFEQAVNYFLGYLTPNMSEYEIEKTLHDKLAQKVTYVTGAPNAHNAYGALVEGEAVCEGYAEALQCLLQRAGIQSVQVYGSSRGENHAWNMVRIGEVKNGQYVGEYYLTDLTWDDQGTTLSYAYFNQTSAVFEEDHAAWKIGDEVDDDGNLLRLTCQLFEFPVCTATKENYYVKNDLVINARNLSDLDFSQLGTLMKNNNLSMTVFVGTHSNFTAADFANWCLNSSNASQIASKAGVSGIFTVKAQIAGREARIWFETCKHTRLTNVSAKPATCDEFGVSAHRKCNDCGKLFSLLTDEKGNLLEIFNRESVNILPKGHDFTIKTVGEGTLKKKAEKCTEHDTYFLTCSVCGVVSDTHTFETEVVGEHNYAAEWQPDNYNTHKRPCLNNCGEALHDAHTDANEDKICDVCGQEKTMLGGLENLIPDIDVGETTDEIIDIILENPLILLGGGGSVALLVIVVIIKKLRG